MEFDGTGFFREARRLDVYRLRKRGSGRRLESFAILDSPPEPRFLNLEWATWWPEPHGSDVVGEPQHVVLEEGWTEFIGYRGELDDVDAEPRKLWRVPKSLPKARVVKPDEAMPLPQFREVAARLAVGPSRDDVDSVAERLVSLLSAEEIGGFWGRLQLELGVRPGPGDVIRFPNDSYQYRRMERVLGRGRAIREHDWGERFLDLADRAASLVAGYPVEHSFTSDGAIPESSPWKKNLWLVVGYFRGRHPGTRVGEEFFYAFTTHYFTGGPHLFPRDLGHAQAEKVLAPLGLEIAGEPQFKEYWMASLSVGTVIELAY